MLETDSLGELQWAHETLLRIIKIVQLNGLIGDPQRACVVHMVESTVFLEGLIQEHLRNARRRRDDGPRFGGPGVGWSTVV